MRPQNFNVKEYNANRTHYIQLEERKGYFNDLCVHFQVIYQLKKDRLARPRIFVFKVNELDKAKKKFNELLNN
jgi:hypothetical protein